MKLAKIQNFSKIKIEDVKFHHNEEGSVVIEEWTGYGLLTIPYHKHIAINRGTRKPVFTMAYYGRLFSIDMREYLMEYLRKRNEEELDILNQEEEERYNTQAEDDKLKNFEQFCQTNYGTSSKIIYSNKG